MLAAVLGLAAGLAVAAALFAMAPTPPPLRTALLDLHRPARSRQASVGGVAKVASAARALGVDRLIGTGRPADLAMSGRDEAWLLSSVLALAAAGLAAGPVVAAVSAAGGVGLPWGVLAGLSAVAGPTLGLSPLLSVRSEAGRRRQEFTSALSAFVDLVVVAMAAGRGTEGALSAAARAGEGKTFEALRDALEIARLRGLPPWDALDELGGRLGVEDLRGLAASIRLAGASGAKVRQSLAARARAMRARGLAESRAAAESETERMSVAVVVLVLGFIVLIGYPAVVQITTQL
jgi:tight adherence protein C